MPTNPMDGDVLLNAGAEIGHDRGEPAGMGKDAIEEHDKMGGNEDHENRRQDHNRFLHSPHIENNQQNGEKTGNGDLVVVEALAVGS